MSALGGTLTGDELVVSSCSKLGSNKCSDSILCRFFWVKNPFNIRISKTTPKTSNNILTAIIYSLEISKAPRIITSRKIDTMDTFLGIDSRSDRQLVEHQSQLGNFIVRQKD